MAEAIKASAKQRRSAAQKKSVGRGMRLVTGDMDGTLFAIVIALLAIGLTMMFSASYPAAIEDGKEGTFYAMRQLKFAGGGLVGMVLISLFGNYHLFEKPWVSIGAFLASLGLLVLVLFRGEDNGTFATRWLTIPGVGVTFQPSEVMKIAVILCFSMMIANNANRMHRFVYGVVPYIAALGVIAILMMKQPHLSGTIIILALGIVLMVVGGCRIWHLAVLGGIGLAIGLIALVAFDKFDYIGERFLAMQDPFNPEYMQNETWQTSQSLIAIGSGGFFGLGLGASRQKYQYLPEAQNDFVFAILCEECGFVGAATVILLFCLLVVRGFYIASKAPDRLGRLIAVGITVHIGMQAFLNIAVVSNLLPNTGISLPFFSYGGTALMMQLAEMGLLLNISRQSSLE
ncbi:MAG: FtsW/RodA/SpoVE family cell cycle protein [Oscillospiraceae bacterium]